MFIKGTNSSLVKSLKLQSIRLTKPAIVFPASLQGLVIDPSDWNKQIGTWRVWISFKSDVGFRERAGAVGPLIGNDVPDHRLVYVHITSKLWYPKDTEQMPFLVSTMVAGQLFNLKELGLLIRFKDIQPAETTEQAAIDICRYSSQSEMDACSGVSTPNLPKPERVRFRFLDPNPRVYLTICRNSHQRCPAQLYASEDDSTDLTLWDVTTFSNGYSTIANVATGECLTTDDSEWSSQQQMCN